MSFSLRGAERGIVTTFEDMGISELEARVLLDDAVKRGLAEFEPANPATPGSRDVWKITL